MVVVLVVVVVVVVVVVAWYACCVDVIELVFGNGGVLHVPE